jgi:hypothetical protein
MINLKKFLTFSSIALYPAFNLFCFNSPVKAEWNDFTLCSIRLQKTGIDPQKSANACGESLDPDELSLCVARINYVTQLSGNEALEGCLRSRRPLELAQCAGDIHRETNGDRQTQNLQPNLILDYCRRSLLPLTFSQCVTGLSNSNYYAQEREVFPVSIENAMQNCLEARP